MEPTEPTEQACFHVDAKTDAALRKEAERLTNLTGKKWTISKVAAAVLDQYNLDSWG